MKERIPDGLMAGFVKSLDAATLKDHTAALVLWIKLRCPNPEKARTVQLDKLPALVPPSLSGFIRALFAEQARRQAKVKKR